MDIYAIRREQLRKAIERLYDGNQSAFAVKVGQDSSYVNRCLYPEDKKGHKRIGEKNARKWEKAAGLAHGYFDNPDADPSLGAPLTIDEELNRLPVPPEQKRELEILFRNQMRLLRGEPIEAPTQPAEGETGRWHQVRKRDE